MATVPDLPGCMSDGETPQEAITNVQDAIEAWLEAAATSARNPEAVTTGSVAPRLESPLQRRPGEERASSGRAHPHLSPSPSGRGDEADASQNAAAPMVVVPTRSQITAS